MKIELSDFVAKPCKSRIAFEFVPKQDYGLDLQVVAKKLREQEVFVEIETPYLLMLKFAGRDVSIFKSSKIIVKSTNDEQEASRIAKGLVEKMNN
ncbi:MAG TPA: hypothetical protein VJG83_04010 [archaeon]|nr:hypothetical protein [archaeon]